MPVVTLASAQPVQRVDRAEPLDVARRWPAETPLIMLHSAPADSPWSRWSMLASPQCTLTITERGHRWRGAPPASMPVINNPSNPLDTLQQALRAAPPSGTWIGFLSYDLGRTVEPTAQGSSGRASDDRHWPLIEFAWCPAMLLHDNVTGAWQTVGDASRLPDIDAARPADDGRGTAPPRFGPLRSGVTADAYRAAVRRVIDAIGAGDIFQANLTQRFSCRFNGSSRTLAVEALRRSGAWFGAYLELPDGRTICSLSPELFLDLDSTTRRITTRPIKGTRPAGVSPDELLCSEKDAAELTMIIDLMRNDLGRVAEFGSVRVPQPRVIESHAGVHHGVGEVVAALREDQTLVDLLRAAMPAGSITGAPKIRAMQIIDELEPVRRGPYCGAIGFISGARDLRLSVGIRTMALTGRRTPGRMDEYSDAQLDYGAGGGIVADSTPESEYEESLTKTAVLREVIEALARPD